MVRMMTELDRLVGDWQQPINRWQDIPNSIHNDDVAHKIGMRGGTIPGTVHLGHFRLLIEQLWGDRWWRTGSISMYYTFATTHKEDVRAMVKVPVGGIDSDVDLQLDAWVENADGMVVCKGTIGVGRPAAPGYVSSLELVPAERDELRILAALRTGDTIGPATITVDDELCENGSLKDITAHYQPLNARFPEASIAQPAVGFFGATEIRLIDGPLASATRYTRTGTVVCVGASPKTEFAWADSSLQREDGTVVAEMRHLTRWMKASSPLWRDDSSS